MMSTNCNVCALLRCLELMVPKLTDDIEETEAALTLVLKIDCRQLQFLR